MPGNSTKNLVIGNRNPAAHYVERRAVRVVVKLPDNNVIIIKAAKGNYFKLPGGGIEDNEDHALAAEREVAEETGCCVKVQGPCLATTEEYRNDLHQISYCYQAVVAGEDGLPTLTDDELEDGLAHERVPLGKALEMMSTIEPTSELGHFIKKRELFLLQVASACG